MKNYLILTLLILSSNFTRASDKINVVQAIHYSAPNLTYRNIAIGLGIYNDGEKLPCTLLYKNENNIIKMTLIVGREYEEIELKNELSSYENPDNDETLSVNFDNQKNVFSYFFEFGNMTNQYTGSHGYQFSLEKISDKEFDVNYYHDWADDDGMSGRKQYKCTLNSQ
jgi:hypothetical protein